VLFKHRSCCVALFRSPLMVADSHASEQPMSMVVLVASRIP
jgi:hypothetical protein